VAYWRTAAGALHELRARGMPLGLMEGMAYEEHEVRLGAGDHILLYSDGLVEAHNPRREMFSFERLAALVAGSPQSGQPLVARLLDELARFTGPGWVQEDDITLVTIACLDLPEPQRDEPQEGAMGSPTDAGAAWHTLAELTIPSAPDNERVAMEQVAAAVASVGLPSLRLERLKTAVAEATMNAMEHGNGYRADQPTQISVRRSVDTLSVRIFDHGTGPTEEAEAPDLALKLDGLQSPRGWGLHIIRNMVDELRVGHEEGRHVIELVVKL
jgi:anti-sigma regulatory factor (Ser/Thr protein kinase)